MIKMIITDAGKQAIINSKNDGTNAVQVTHIGIGSGRYVADKTQIALKEEIKRLPIIEGGSAGDNAIHVAYQDGTDDYYSVYEFGVFLKDGTLFAVYSQDAVILSKNIEEVVNLVVDVALDDVDANNITFGDVEYGNPAATTQNAGVVALATPAEAIDGTNTQKAVTPQGVKSVIDGYGIVAEGGITPRKLAEHLGDKLSPKDFGAVGDGTGDDTAAFTALESAVTGKDIDLLGESYIVNFRPLKNNYYNGTFIIGGKTVKPVYDFYKFGGTAERDIDVKRDFSEVARGGAALLAADYVRKGTGAGAVVQSVAWDDVNRYMYSMHATSADMGVINRFSTMKMGANVTNESSAYTAPSAYIGHQGLGIQHTGGGNIKLWASMAYETAGAAVESKGTKIVRFNAPTAENQNIDSSVEIFNVFPAVSGSNQATTVCVSYSGKYLICKYSINGTNNYRIRIFKTDEFTTPGDYSERYIHEFTITLTRDTDTGGIEKALQGMACDDRYIYFLAGTYGYANKHSIYISDMFGNVVDEYRDVSIGKEIGMQIGTSYYEPESLFFMSLNGQKKLVMQIATGDTTGRRLLHLVALNVRQSYYFPVGSDYGNFHAVTIDEQARVVNAEGNANFSVYPSGLGTNYTARRGANQTVQARFSDDAAGNAYVMYKSRGTKVGESLSVQAGDIIGQVLFMADNGNVDYNGTVQGARAAYIEGGVFESSTIPADGNTNIGVRGYLRLYACSDENSRAGKGVEILDNGFRPTEDNIHNLGTSGRRWKAVYAMTDVISTSDESQKQDIVEIPDNVLEAWGNVDFKQFRFISDVEQSGDDAQKYFGVIAQHILSVFEAAGLDACEYGLISKDKQEDGSYLYGVRYREALVLEAAYNRKFGGGGGGGNTEDYTAFQVYATREIMPIGTIYTDSDGNTYTDANGNTMTYKMPWFNNGGTDTSVPANAMTQKTHLRSTVPPDENDIRIEWGDGTSTAAANADEIEDKGNGEWSYTFFHEYSAVGYYDVKITGKDYFGIQHYGENSNQICKIFEEGYPVASCVTSMTGLCTNAAKLVRINASKAMPYFAEVHSVNEMFSGCYNLQEVKNFSQYVFQYLRTANKMFYHCNNLLTCDWRMPSVMLSSSGYQNIFGGCEKLKTSIANLLPQTGFATSKVDLTGVFNGCSALTGTVPANLLWENEATEWTGTDFVTGCSTAIRSQCPASWGGTAAEPNDTLTGSDIKYDGSESGLSGQDYTLSGAIDATFSHYSSVSLEVSNLAGRLDSAETRAEEAYTKADSAYTMASDAMSWAQTANNAASTAQSTADSATSSASFAYELATAATTTAENAQSTANGAYNEAGNAKASADGAYNRAEEAYTKADEAYNEASSAYGHAESAISFGQEATNKAQDALDKVSNLDGEDVTVSIYQSDYDPNSGAQYMDLQTALTTMQDRTNNRVKTVNGNFPDASGNVEIEIETGGGLGYPDYANMTQPFGDFGLCSCNPSAEEPPTQYTVTEDGWISVNTTDSSIPSDGGFFQVNGMPVFSGRQKMLIPVKAGDMFWFSPAVGGQYYVFFYPNRS